jgi:hypothetical protein
MVGVTGTDHLTFCHLSRTRLTRRTDTPASLDNWCSTLAGSRRIGQEGSSMVGTDVSMHFIEAMEHAVYCEDLSDMEGRRPFDRGCWTLELADAISGARDGRYAFYAVVDGERVDLVVDARPDGATYLRPVDPDRAHRADRGYARPVSPR